jgi:2-methylcitrate dehydratase
VLEDEIAVADAHPLGARPFTRVQYIAKFRLLAGGAIAPAEQDRFIETVERLPKLKADDLSALTFTVDPSLLGTAKATGIFDWRADSASASRGLSVVG